jgi:hypothetical protein
MSEGESRPRVRRPQISGRRRRIVLCLLVAWAGMAAVGSAQNPRLIHGRVIGSSDQPLLNAVVYLENQKSLEVKTYITDTDGSFRFGQLSSEVDYQVWAKYQDRKSKTRSISSFDSKKEFEFDLKVDTKK